jgi:succinate dehydrogenase / fumarate reductase cytochrome b subunit
MPDEKRLTGRSVLKNSNRPINVGIGDLLQFSWPITALASITHRVAGVALFVAFGFALYVLELSLSSASGFEEVQTLLTSGIAKSILWVSLAALIYHFVAGIKHLLLDGSDAESLAVGRTAAIVTLLVSLALIALMTLWVI